MSTTLAAVCLHLLEHYDGPDEVDVGAGSDVTIRELAEIVADAVGFVFETHWDTANLTEAHQHCSTSPGSPTPGGPRGLVFIRVSGRPPSGIARTWAALVIKACRPVRGA
jgi:hypothetical protein